MKSITLLESINFKISLIALTTEAEKYLLPTTTLSEINHLAAKHPNWFAWEKIRKKPIGERATELNQ